MDASRFAVPAGKIATAVFSPASASTQCWTMPSPPHTKIRPAPSSSAALARLGAFRLFSTSYQSGSG